VEKGILPIGQVTGLIHDEPTVAELFDRIVAEAKAVQEKLSRQVA
jgi:NAD(P)H-dependent flavin oxidoreductase YrpB (nitropropane dioxygenase family)